MNGKITKITLATVAVMSMMLGFLASPASAATIVNEELTTSEGATDLLGGGDHFFVKFGTDAAFGIVWGTNETENNVYFVALKAKYLGFAQVYDKQGNIVEENHTIKIWTLYAVKLSSLLEFNDLNQDGALDYTRTYDEATEKYTSYVATEPLYKKVDLKTAWDASPVEYTEADDTKHWSFDLTAANESYQLLDAGAAPAVGDDMLNQFKLTFNLEAKAVQVDNAELPQWKLTVTTGPLGKTWVTDAERMQNIQVNGDVVRYGVKWDQEIQGWDFDTVNANPMLMLEFESLVGNSFPAAWMGAAMLQYMNAVSVMNCASVEGNLTVNETTGDLERPKQLIQTRLTFTAGWTSVGNLTWVDDATVDGEPALVRAQVMAAHRVLGLSADGKVFVGFVALGGMSFPGGSLIIHDPTFTTDALVNVDTTTKTLPVFMIGLVLGVVVIIGVAVVAVSMGHNKKPGQGVRNSYEKSTSSQPGAWTKYYNKK